MRGVGRKMVLLQDGSEHGLDFFKRSRCDYDLVAKVGRHVRAVVNQVVRTIRSATMIEELDTHIAVDRKHPIADLMNLVD